MRLAGPYAQPVFHPVTEKVFPAEPIVIVRSHIPGNVARNIIMFMVKLYIILCIIKFVIDVSREDTKEVDWWLRLQAKLCFTNYMFHVL